MVDQFCFSLNFKICFGNFYSPFVICTKGGEQAVKILFLHYWKNGQGEMGAVVAGGNVRW